MKFNYEKVRILRLKKGMTIKNLADVLKLTTVTISNTELGYHQPTITNINKIRKYFKLEAKDFFID